MDDSRANGVRVADDPLFAPGLKRRPRAGGGEARYWIPPARCVKAGWSLKLVPFDSNLSELEVAERCRGLWAELDAWRSGQPGKVKHTISWLINRYQTDEYSPYKSIRDKTRRGYDQSCRIIGDDVGTYLIDSYIEGGMMRPRLFGADIREWHRRWMAPAKTGQAPRIVRALHAMAMLRILFSYAVELGVPGADYLREMVGTIRIPTSEPRASAPARAMVLAHVAKSAELGLLSLAIATLAQFEFTERRTHIIGTWEGPQWRPGWVWTQISPDWKISYHQTKIGKVERQYDLKDTPALLELLQRVPEEKRIGPVILCERTGKPWKERHFMQQWRKIAREIGIPDDIWSMDMRAGGATEAGQLQGVTPMDLQAAGGWKDQSMMSRYTRDHSTRAQKVVKLRGELAGPSRKIPG